MVTRNEMEKLLGGPIRMGSNTFYHFYNGGKLRAEFMGEMDPKDDFRSEEWMFSTNRAMTPGQENPPEKGISKIRLSNETILLTELLEEFPEETFGSKHYQKFGAKLGVLVKIFDVGEGSIIPVHWHPAPEFAQQYLNSPFGKTEAWIIVAMRPGAAVWIGWSETFPIAQFKNWVKDQDKGGDAMRDNMCQIEPKVGDVFYIPAGIVHSIQGCMVLEPQEPTDWSMLAEFGRFHLTEQEAWQGLDFQTAAKSLELKALDRDMLYDFIIRKPIKGFEDRAGNRIEELLPHQAKSYFNAERYTVTHGTIKNIEPSQGFYCLTVLRGTGQLRGAAPVTLLRRGTSILMPACLAWKQWHLLNNGEKPLEVVICYPPAIS